MKNFDFKKLIPHLVAVAVFLIIAAVYCSPSLQSGVVIKQPDVSSWEGMSHQSMLHKDQTGHFPLWATSMFSGMPAFQIAAEGYWTPLSIIDHIFQLFLPKPMNFFWLACICFYFLCLCVRIRPYAAVAGALGFAFCSFSPIIVSAGHDTQMLALAYAPAVIGSVMLIFRKKYLVGGTLAALFTQLQVSQGHQQISYYLFIVLVIMSAAYIIKYIRAHQASALMKALGIILIAGLTGVLSNALGLFPAYDYAKESKRGGQLVMNEQPSKGENTVNGKTTGLSKAYAFQWSYGRAETMSLMFPGVMGYGFHYASRNNENYIFPQLKEDANSVKLIVDKFNLGEAQTGQVADQMSQSLYWGDQPFTNGPVYLGAVICFLFIFGMFYLDGKHKWWILTASLLAILMSWGSHFDAFNGFLFNHLPLYSKFRVPTMALVIPQMLFPIIAALTLNKLLDNVDPDAWKKYKLSLAATALVFVIAIGFYMSAGYSNENTKRTVAFNAMMANPTPATQDAVALLEPKSDNNIYEGWITNLKGSPDAQNISREILGALRKDRASLLGHDILIALLFVLLTAGIIFLYLKKNMNPLVMVGGITLMVVIDLMILDTKYLNDKNYEDKDTYEETEFPMTNADRTILQDKDPNYRVFNMSVGSPFEDSKTSYYHKSVGGYHAAKLGIYDDLSSNQMGRDVNPAVLNMLNTRYVIQGEGDKIAAIRNPGALGNAWFIKGISFVNGPVAEMRALDNLNTKDSAVADAQFKSLVTDFTPADSSATIRMTAFDNDAISYESNTSSGQLAVFSEIYYKDWKAYIDGKPAPYFKVNYVLRAMMIPAGKHAIDFKFEPEVFFISKKIAAVASYLLVLFLLLTIIVLARRKNVVVPAEEEV